MTVGETLNRQFTQVWETMREAINNFPVEQWRVGDINWQVPARLALHAIEGADYYARVTPKGYPPGGRWGEYWDAMPEKLPTQEQLLTYLDEIKTRVETWLKGMTDADLLSPNPERPHWENVLQLAIYLLRHIQHHLGQLCAELRRRGLPVAEWK